tara:strand:- start:450 stop:986 length:537 start_codon:yes stop_codon:yes gene_type:complete
MNYIFYIYNILGFKVCWWACVLGATSGQKYLGPALVFLYLIIHIYNIKPDLRKSELYLLFFAGIFGTFIDSLLLNLNILSYEGLYNNINYVAPLWITAMWVGFTATLNHAFKNIINKYFTQIILGLIFGPMAYVTGNSLGAIKFIPAYNDNVILIVIAIAWGFSFPLLCWMSNKIRRL